MILRLRSRVGTWREEVNGSLTISALIATVEHKYNCTIKKVSKSQNYSDLIDKSLTVDALGLKHGDMIFIDASGASKTELLSSKSSKTIDANGNLIAAKQETVNGAFRPGLQALRTQKLHWTLTDMVEFDNKYTFEVKGEHLSFCSSVSCDQNSLDSFQQYLQNFAFGRKRCAYLYGKFVNDNEIVGSEEYKKKKEENDGYKKSKNNQSVKRKMKLSDLDALTKNDLKPKQGVLVEAIYEPLQENNENEFILLEDPREDKVEIIAKGLGLEKVGFLFSHPPGRDGYTFSTHEIINSGEQALEATDGKRDSAFCILACTGLLQDGRYMADFQSYSLTPQCIDMVAEDALLQMKDNPGHSSINETFTLIVEKKEAHVVDNDFFIKRIPIIMHQNKLANNFPSFNRPLDKSPDNKALKTVLSKLGRNPTDASIAKALNDFNILIYLSVIFDSNDELEAIAKFVASHTVDGLEPLPLESGYKVVIFSSAEIEIDL